MSKLNIKGRLYYPPGPWGAFKPVPNARITITDIDTDGRNDRIFTARTDDGGRFGGLSNEWQDKIRVRYWQVDSLVPPSGHWAYRTQPDVTDLMILSVKIEADGQVITGPFPFAGDGVEVPLVVTWAPPPAKTAWGTVNGVEFNEFQELIDKFIMAVEARDPIELKLYGDWADAVDPLVELLKKSPLELAQQVFPGSYEGSLVLLIGGTFVTIGAAELGALALLALAIGGMILLTGAAVFVTALGVAVIFAIAAGYCEINTSQDTTYDNNGNPTNETSLSLKNAGC